MDRSATPILDLEVLPPPPRGHLTARGLLKATPVAVGLIALLLSAGVYIQVIFDDESPGWLNASSLQVFRDIRVIFENGPWVPVVCIWLVMFAVIVVHELGHALAALALAWPVLEFRAVPLCLRKQDGLWKIRFCWTALPPGLVIANPTAIRLHRGVRIYALSGPIANLATGALVFLLLPHRQSTTSAIAELFAVWSQFVGLLNLLPLHLRNVELDGFVAFVVSRKPKLLARRIAAMKLGNHLRSAKALHLMNRRWVALAEESKRVSLQNRMGLWLAYSYWSEREQYDRAATILEAFLRYSDSAEEKFRATLYAEAAVLAALRGQIKQANTWKERAWAFSLPDLVLHRCACCVAWANKAKDEAHREWELAREAGMKLGDPAIRSMFLESWDRWLNEMNQRGPTAPEVEAAANTA